RSPSKWLVLRVVLASQRSPGARWRTLARSSAMSVIAFATDRRSGVRQRRRPRVRASERLPSAVSLPSAAPGLALGRRPRRPPLATGAVRMFAQRLRRDTRVLNVPSCASSIPKRKLEIMEKAEKKIVQYLNEAHATEQALVTVLQSQIAMTTRGSYRDGLETHLRETRDHATRVQRRLDEL